MLGKSLNAHPVCKISKLKFLKMFYWTKFTSNMKSFLVAPWNKAFPHVLKDNIAFFFLILFFVIKDATVIFLSPFVCQKKKPWWLLFRLGWNTLSFHFIHTLPHWFIIKKDPKATEWEIGLMNDNSEVNFTTPEGNEKNANPSSI